MPENKQNPISPESLSRFNDFIAHHLGLNFKDSRLAELERGIRLVSPTFGCTDPEACIRKLLTSTSSLSKQQIEILSVHLTVGETYFFREKETFSVLENDILPQLSREAGGGPRSLRIWSTACSSGEEPYSIAIILDQKKELLKDWHITLLATDINRLTLEKAQTGIYSEWSFRNTPTWVKQRYFTPTDKKSYAILPHLKQMVTFQYLNLVEDVYPSMVNNTNGMDIIFCRNVLMYFLPEKADVVVQRLYRSLVTDGWLMLSPTDSFHLLNREGFRRHQTSASVFTKSAGKDEAQQAMDVAVSLTTAPEPPPVYSPGIPPAVDSPEFVSPLSTAAEFIPAAGEEEKGPAADSEAISQYTAAQQLYSRGSYPEVITRLEETLKKMPAPDISQGDFTESHYLYGDMCELLARAYANLGQLDKAAQWCQKAIGTDKLHPGYHYLLVTILQEQGSDEAALQALKKCLYIDPDFLLAHFTLGNIQFRRGEVKEAKKHWDIALSLLEPCGDDEIASFEEGLTAGRLREIIQTTLKIRDGATP